MNEDNITAADGENDQINSTATGSEINPADVPLDATPRTFETHADGTVHRLPPVKTFTQEDVNRIISERLYREKSKLEADIAQRECELNQREFMFKAREILTKKKLPLELLDALHMPDDEALSKSLDIIEKLLKEHNPYKINFGAPTHTTGISDNKGASIRNAMGLI